MLVIFVVKYYIFERVIWCTLKKYYYVFKIDFTSNILSFVVYLNINFNSSFIRNLTLSCHSSLLI